MGCRLRGSSSPRFQMRVVLDMSLGHGWFKTQYQIFASVGGTTRGSTGSGPSCPDVSTDVVAEVDGLAAVFISAICRSVKKSEHVRQNQFTARGKVSQEDPQQDCRKLKL